MSFLGDCRDECLIEEVFGSVSELQRLVEEHGDNFTIGKINVRYDEENDIHSFYLDGENHEPI